MVIFHSYVNVYQRVTTKQSANDGAVFGFFYMLRYGANLRCYQHGSMWFTVKVPLDLCGRIHQETWGYPAW